MRLAVWFIAHLVEPIRLGKMLDRQRDACRSVDQQIVPYRYGVAQVIEAAGNEERRVLYLACKESSCHGPNSSENGAEHLYPPRKPNSLSPADGLGGEWHAQLV